MDSMNDLPFEVIVDIFSYLSRRDRINCWYVCNYWREVLNTPSLWRNIVVYLDTDLLEPSTIVATRLYHEYFKTMEFCWTNPRLPARWMQHGFHEFSKRASRYLMALQNSFIELKCVRINDWYDIFKLKKVIYHLCSFLRSQNSLVKVCFFNVNFNRSECVKLLASCLSSINTLKYLDISNCFHGQSLIFESTTFLSCLERLENLTILKLDYTTLCDGVIDSILTSKNTQLNYMEVIVRECDNSSEVIDDNTWSKLCKQCPQLKVAIYFRNVCYFEDIFKLLRKSIPLSTFSLTCGRVWDQTTSRQYRRTILLLINTYNKTLENVSLQISYNREVVDDLLLSLINKCANLKYLNFEGVIENMDVLSEICKTQTESTNPTFKYFHISPGDINPTSHATLSELHGTYARKLIEKNVDFKIDNNWNRNMVFVYY